MYVFDITAIGRHILVLAEDQLDDDYVLLAVYSTVSGEWSVYPTLHGRQRTENTLFSLSHIGHGIVLLLVSSTDSKDSFLCAPIPLPPGDDYESAGRWNVLDPDHD
ncbi:hypothetical protein KIPB_001196 [Kipferlia bialata]|uniref:Uncharacterized protein n=1 Tax=Kipferlia bialata TaxID=797122 RepID=A0A391NTX9_9EUKA|nr:hypothetical protein KIPB_001196 [Kipferlia bialata]|eukprot:g1196.t1